MRLMILGITISAALIGVADHAAAIGPAHVNLRPCASDEGESAYPCVWSAATMGNGRGHSFRIYRDGRLKYISDDRAESLMPMK